MGRGLQVRGELCRVANKPEKERAEEGGNECDRQENVLYENDVETAKKKRIRYENNRHRRLFQQEVSAAGTLWMRSEKGL